MRVKTGTTRRAKHTKILKLAKGYRMARHRRYKVAKENVLHAGNYAFAGRKLRKRSLRRLWITRIDAALLPFNLKYSRFIELLGKANVKLDRKVLANLAVTEPETFSQIVKTVTALSFVFFFLH